MSGSLGSILNTFLSATIDQAPVILGAVTFEGHEVPSRIGVGGAHAVTIHKLPGGGRVVDAMGVDDGAISWSGFFTGPNAAGRARLVDAMRQNGELVGLSFSDYTFNVVVVHFEYDLQDRGALITYKIRMEIVPDSLPSVSSTPDALAGGLSDDSGSAATILGQFGLSAAQAAVLSVQTALAGAGDVTATTTLAVLESTLRSAALAVQGSIAAASSGVTTGESLGSSGTSPSSALSAATFSAGQLAGSVQAAGYLNRSNIWLSELGGEPQGAPLISA